MSVGSITPAAEKSFKLRPFHGTFRPRDAETAEKIRQVTVGSPKVDEQGKGLFKRMGEWFKNKDVPKFKKFAAVAVPLAAVTAAVYVVVNKIKANKAAKEGAQQPPQYA
jgi:negative regulator of sigma E activity